MTENALETLDDVRLLILQNDFTVIGFHNMIEIDIDKTWVHILDFAALVRKAGSTLGDITLHGPHADTVIDRCGNIEIPQSQVIMMIQCDTPMWAHILTNSN